MVYLKKQAFFGLGTVLSLIVGCTGISPQNLYDQAVRSLEKGDYQKGINSLDRVIEFSPEFSEAYVNRGIAYDELGESEEAIANYDQAIQINSNLASAYYHRANAQHKLGDFQKAIDDYSQTIQLSPDYAAAYGNRGSTYDSLGEQHKAVEDLQKAAQLFSQQGDEQRAQFALSRVEEIESVKYDE